MTFGPEFYPRIHRMAICLVCNASADIDRNKGHFIDHGDWAECQHCMIAERDSALVDCFYQPMRDPYDEPRWSTERFKKLRQPLPEIKKPQYPEPKHKRPPPDTKGPWAYVGKKIAYNRHIGSEIFSPPEIPKGWTLVPRPIMKRKGERIQPKMKEGWWFWTPTLRGWVPVKGTDVAEPIVKTLNQVFGFGNYYQRNRWPEHKKSMVIRPLWNKYQFLLN